MQKFLLGMMMASMMFGADVLEVKYATKDVKPAADPKSAFWKDIAPVMATRNNLGVELPTNKTEIRLRWTDKNLYILMSCPYEALYVNEKPSVTTETNKLWERDVAEVFVGADFTNIHQYKEYQVSPLGEWVDLDIDNKKPLPEGGWKWDSKMVTKARIDEKAKIWYAEFQIPIASFTAKKVEPGLELRGNFYRFQGPGPDRKMVAWKPTGRINNHTPAAFGTLKLVK